MLEQTKREQIAYQMENHKIDILCLQETHMNTNSMEKVDGYTFIYSSGLSDKDRETREKQKKTHRKRKGKGKRQRRM